MIDKKKLLVISNHKETRTLFNKLAAMSNYSAPIYETSLSQAKMRLNNEHFDLVAIQTPLKDEFGTASARQMASLHHLPVLLFVNPELYDQTLYQVNENSVYVFSSTTGLLEIYQSIMMIDKMNDMIAKLEAKLAREKQKARDEKTIARCKLMLIENYRWSEEKAHHYIEKVAMDHSMTKVLVSKTLLSQMEARKAASLVKANP